MQSSSHTPDMPKNNKPKSSKPIISILLFILSVLALSAGFYFYHLSQQQPEVEVLTRDGVIMQIKELSRLQTIVFEVDTVITSRKQGNWYSLWQDEQKGLFVAHGRVNAGIDLNKISASQVTVSPINRDEAGNPIIHSDADLNIDVQLPAAEIFDVYLENIEVYDLQTGLFGILKTDPVIFEKAQESGKYEVLRMACQGGVLQMATDNAQKQVIGLFKLTGATVTVHTVKPSECQARV